MSTELEKTNSVPPVPQRTGGLAVINTKMTEAALSKMILPPVFHQLVVFLLDSSLSMTWRTPNGIQKSVEVTDAVRKIIDRLKLSKNCSSFDITVWCYGNQAIEIIPLNNVTKIDPSSMNYDPMDYEEEVNYTSILSALQQTGEIALKYLTDNKEKQCQALFVVLSDGIINDHAEAIEYQNNLTSGRPGISFCTSFFAEPDDSENFSLEQQKLGREIMSDMASPGHFAENISAEEIRIHMIKSISLISHIDDIR